MRTPVTTALVLTLLVLGRGWAAEKEKPASQNEPLALKLPEVPPASAPQFSAAQAAYVQSWIKSKAPECPPVVAAAAAEQFLAELQLQYPDKFDQLLSLHFPTTAFDSLLLRMVGAKLTAAEQGSLREEIARRRVGAALISSGREAQAAAKDATGLTAKIKEASSVQYRRLVEGRMDDDDLELLLKKTGQLGTEPKTVAPAQAKVLTATEIVSEFVRHNQTGSALQRLQAYTLEGKLKTASGEEQHLLIFKLRPNRFRLVVIAGGSTRYLLASDGEHFWQQAPGRSPQIVSPQEMGSRLYLAEFVDPLFAEEGYHYEKLSDGVVDGKKIYRIGVQRSDNSHYIAGIDQENFREVSREESDKSTAHYSDFREVAGVTYAFREEATDAAGRKGVFELVRITANPGLIPAFFVPSAEHEMGYFEIERLLARAPTAPGK